MSKEQQSIIKQLLQAIKDSESCEGMPYSTSRELISLVRELEVA